MGCLSRQRHGCHCSRAQTETAQESCERPSEEGACPLRLPLAFPQRVPRLDKVSQTDFFIREPGQNRQLNLSLWGQYRPGPDTDMQDSPSNTSISFHSYEIFSLLATAEVFHYLLGVFPLFCLPFLTIYSYLVIPLFIFFSSFPLYIISMHSRVCSFVNCCSPVLCTSKYAEGVNTQRKCHLI